MYLGYNTNGLAHHALHDAIELLHEIGYRGIAITLDHAVLNPYSESLRADLATTKELTAGYEAESVVGHIIHLMCLRMTTLSMLGRRTCLFGSRTVAASLYGDLCRLSSIGFGVYFRLSRQISSGHGLLLCTLTMLA